MGITRKQVNTRKRCPRVARQCSVKEGTGVNTRGGQVLTRYQHRWFQFKVRHLLLGQSRPPSCISSPHATT